MKRILVVDDEVEICEFLKSFFDDRGFQVFVAHSGEDALKVVDSVKPHMTLLDIQMPGMDGLTALRQIKAKFPQTKVIMVTAVETREKIEEAMRAGADNYITKPLSLDYLEKDVYEKISYLAGSDFATS